MTDQTITDEQRAAWLRLTNSPEATGLDGARVEDDAALIARLLPDALTNPQPALPTDLDALANAWQLAAYSFGAAEAGGEPEDADRCERLADSARDAFRAALAAERARADQALADRWDEGYETGCEDRYGTSTPGGQPYDPTPNPYRAAPSAEQGVDQ